MIQTLHVCVCVYVCVCVCERVLVVYVCECVYVCVYVCILSVLVVWDELDVSGNQCLFPAF